MLVCYQTIGQLVGHSDILIISTYFPPAHGTETIALAQDDGTYKLFGYKWFSSATDADMTLTLARICDSLDNTVPVSAQYICCIFVNKTKFEIPMCQLSKEHIHGTD